MLSLKNIVTFVVAFLVGLVLTGIFVTVTSAEVPAPAATATTSASVSFATPPVLSPDPAGVPFEYAWQKDRAGYPPPVMRGSFFF